MMRDYGVEAYGLLLNDNDMKHLASKLCSDYSESEYDENPWDFIEEVEYRLNIEYISEFEGDAVKIRDDGVDDWCSTNNYDNYAGDTIHYLPFHHFPSLFKAAYSNIQEVIDEMKERIEPYLPADFDYRGRLRHIIGTYFG